MKFRFSIFIVAIFAMAGCSTLETKSSADLDNAGKTALFYEEMIEGESPNIAQLTLFFSKMPKGGDLHNHYSGSIYAETYLDWASDADYWIDKNTFNISKEKTNTSISVNQLRSNAKLYRKLLTLWSDKNYQDHYHLQLPPDASFFNTFSYFGPVSWRYHDGLMILKERAIKENVSYIEMMFKSVGYSKSDTSFDKAVREAGSKEAIFSYFDKIYSEINKDQDFKQKVDGFIETIKEAHKGVDDDQFMMRYQTYASRNSPPSIVFSALYSAFKAVEQSDLLVGVNIVGPENGVVAIADYNLHMQMFAYLSSKLPNVNKALHAGELALGMVRPKNLKFHISQAIHIADAQRIGHGVDLPYEEEAINLLWKMKENSVVEICLTSNEFILGVKGSEHPYHIYSAYGVPMVICTDDSGISRNNLTGEYVLLAGRYKPSYQTVKEYVYNSIEYSFSSAREKKLLISSLDQRFEKFEAEMSKYSDLIFR